MKRISGITNRLVSVVFLGELAIFFWIASAGQALADEIYLKNGDRLSGETLAVTADHIHIKTQAAGTVVVEKKFIERVQSGSIAAKEPAVPPPTPKEWKVLASAGFGLVTGNTRSAGSHGGVFANKKTGRDEWTLQAEGAYSSEREEMTSQRYGGMARYAYSFGAEKKWYNFYRQEADHDRFANIDYRLIPSTGVGYWFADTPSWKWLIELGLGYEYTNYRAHAEDGGEVVLVPRLFLEKTVFRGIKISHNLVVYPAISGAGTYRISSRTAVNYPITERLSATLNLTDEYNSADIEGIKNNDLQLTTGLAYEF